MGTKNSFIYKPYWLAGASISLVISGCAVQKKQPVSYVKNIYTYEVAKNTDTPAKETKPLERSNGDLLSNPQSVEAVPENTGGIADTQLSEQPQSAGSGLPPMIPPQIDAQELDIRPGQCWVYAQIHPRPVMDSVTVNVRDSETRLDVTPAEFRRGFKQVVTREGTKTFRVIPASYREIEEQVLVKPETTRLVVEPAVYKDFQEDVILEQARTELEACRTSGAAAYGASSAVFGFCAKEIPARTKTVTVSRLITPEVTRTEVIPAEYKTVLRRLVDTPAQIIPVELDDEIDTLEITELVEPAQTKEREVPAETLNVDIKRYEGRPHVVARQAVCDRDLTRDMVQEMQNKLLSLGYSPGKLDGLPGPDTLNALAEYQTENGLASGAVTIETAQRLGIID